ncbi:uncharacterized protein BDV14DRAFT_8462 [Aspergillus stella-maris]|uniref:uncharacterized protein n=1 Tax=Aspergillus stella-maris TaxID=1810926 RepID=UPI003CCDDCCA
MVRRNRNRGFYSARCNLHGARVTQRKGVWFGSQLKLDSPWFWFWYNNWWYSIEIKTIATARIAITRRPSLLDPFHGVKIRTFSTDFPRILAAIESSKSKPLTKRTSDGLGADLQCGEKKANTNEGIKSGKGVINILTMPYLAKKGIISSNSLSPRLEYPECWKLQLG